jgi:chaperonin GroES
MKLIPLHDWAVIVPAQAATKTEGGLYIPDTAREKPEEGVIEAIGPGAFEEEKPGKKKTGNGERRFIPTIVKPGDRVLFERWAGRTHTIGTEERILVRERDILGLIERPLQIPQATTSASSTAIVPREIVPPPMERAGAKQSKPKAPKKAAKKKTAAKASKKATAKASVKSVKKSMKKKAASKSVSGKKAKKKK